MNNKKDNIKKFIIVLLVLMIPAVIVLLIEPSKKAKKDVTNEKVEEKMHFVVQNAVNYYLENLESKNKDYVYYNLLDTKYIEENNITINNISEKINFNINYPVYVAKNIKKLKYGRTDFYFVNGYSYDYNGYIKDDNYLVIVENNLYVIRPLDNNYETNKIISNYGKSGYIINKGERLPSYSYNEKSRLTSYISEFLNLLIIDNYRAYEMLTENTKKKYSSYNDFSNRYDEINSIINTLINVYDKKTDNDINYYNVTLKNGKEIIIIEKAPMDYKIEF